MLAKMTMMVGLNLFMAHGCLAQNTVLIDLFHIERNKNRNLVQYAIELDAQTCKAINNNAIKVFWKMLGEGPNETEDLLIFEQPAYGVKNTEIDTDSVTTRLNAIESKIIRITTEKTNDTCTANPTTLINSQQSRLARVYVQAKERTFLWPKVQWIDVYGQNTDGSELTERIEK
jgi:hypothetical protein